MKRKHLLGIGLLSAAVLLTGCLADTAESATDLVPISLTSVVEAQTSPAGRSATRTTATDLQSDQLPSGEPFYVHFPSGVKQLSGADLTGTTFTADGSGGTSSVTQQPFFARSATSATLHAYHGKSGGTAQVTEATTKFAVALDQSSDDAYKESDLLYATTSVDKAYPSVTAALHFTHKMSKVMVSVTLGAGISSVSAVRIIGGTKAIAIANPTTTDESTAAYLGAASADAADQLSDADGKRIILYSGSYTDKNTALGCAGLIPPQTVTGNFLQVVTSNGTATYSLASKTFAPGESYAYNITVTSASLGITTQITDWTAAGDPTELENGGTATLLPDPGVALASATVGMIVGSNGKAYNVSDKDNMPSGVSAVAVVGYKNGTSGYALALVDASDQTWDEITNNGANKNVDCTLAEGKRGNVPAAPTGTTWKVLNKANYEAVFVAMGSTTGDNNGKTYDTNVNKYITDAGGSGLSGDYWSSQEVDAYYGWGFTESCWYDDFGNPAGSDQVRPALAW